MTYRTLTYQQKAEIQSNPTAKQFLELVYTKQTNLCLSLDLTSKEEALALLDKVGPYICLVKTHIDIVLDFDWKFIEDLQALAKEHNFMIFEDRKFADIGNTVKHQYGQGIYKIASWSDFTNCHVVPGPGIIEGLKQVGTDATVVPQSRALLLLAELSSAGSLAVGDYTQSNLEMARQHKDFVVGFIGSKQFGEESEGFITMTPGISLKSKGDGLGQQYRVPELIIQQNLSDIIIVGRSILNSEDPEVEAALYRRAGWDAYLASFQSEQ